MQQELFRQSPNSDKLILFFNGWAMTHEAVDHLSLPDGYDLLHVCDYRSDNFKFDPTPYKEIHLTAWSMGVWEAERLSARGLLPAVTSATAICGTGFPMDDQMGIPLTIFQGTLDGLTDENRLRFNRRMCGGKSLKKLFDALSSRETNDIKAELGRVFDAENERLKGDNPYPSTPLQWNKAWIGERDRIIPVENQKRFWQLRACPDIEILPDGDHYLFNHFTEWQSLWEQTV